MHAGAAARAPQQTPSPPGGGCPTASRWRRGGRAPAWTGAAAAAGVPAGSCASVCAALELRRGACWGARAPLPQGGCAEGPAGARGVHTAANAAAGLRQPGHWQRCGARSPWQPPGKLCATGGAQRRGGGAQRRGGAAGDAALPAAQVCASYTLRRDLTEAVKVPGILARSRPLKPEEALGRARPACPNPIRAFPGGPGPLVPLHAWQRRRGQQDRAGGCSHQLPAKACRSRCLSGRTLACGQQAGCTVRGGRAPVRACGSAGQRAQSSCAYITAHQGHPSACVAAHQGQAATHPGVGLVPLEAGRAAGRPAAAPRNAMGAARPAQLQ